MKTSSALTGLLILGSANSIAAAPRKNPAIPPDVLSHITPQRQTSAQPNGTKKNPIHKRASDNSAEKRSSMRLPRFGIGHLQHASQYPAKQASQPAGKPNLPNPLNNHILRNPILKMLTKASTYPLNTALKESAALRLRRPNIAQGNYKGVVPHTLTAGLDVLLCERLDEWLQALIEHPALTKNPDQQALRQALKEAVAYITAVIAISALENSLKNKPLLDGVGTSLLIVFAHKMLLDHMGAMTDKQAPNLLGKFVVPMIASAYGGAALANNINGLPREEHRQHLNPVQYSAFSCATTALQIALYELLKANLPPPKAS